MADDTSGLHVHVGDIPAGLDFGPSVAVDTETQGLLPHRDRLCVVQLSSGDGTAHLVQLRAGAYDAPNLKALIVDPTVDKIFHYARFDVAIMKKYLGVTCASVYCTKVASKLVRTYTDGHGLKSLVSELLNIQLDKEQQSSDWATESLSPAQIKYAAADVLYLHQLRAELDRRLMREGRMHIAKACFAFLETRAELDLLGWGETDIFHH